MTKHRGLFLGLALTALMGLSAGQARAETISMFVQVGAGPVQDLALFGGVGTAQGYSMSTAAITALNAYLVGQSSRYAFATTGTVLGGQSNFPGSSLEGSLTLTGTVNSVRAGEAKLTILQIEDAFTAPTGPAGTLFSSSTGNFNLQPAGAGHMASSTFNATTAGPYNVFSSGTAPNPQGNATSVGLAPVPTLYTLTNTIVFNLAVGTPSNPVQDGFNVIATVRAVPEPASLVMMVTGMPIPLVVLGMLRRRGHTA